MLRYVWKKGRVGLVGASCVAALIAILLALAPFAAALEIHHALAEADHDGHEHSEFDLCQWVQLHSAGSSDLSIPDVVGTPAPPNEFASPSSAVVLSLAILPTGPSRAPPQS